MRKVQGILAFKYFPNDSHVFLEDHPDAYRFDSGLEFDGAIEPGALVTLTLITVPGPNPANSSKTQFDVERIAAIHVRQPAISAQSSFPAKLKLVG